MISPQARRHGHYYNSERVNAPCERCSADTGVLVLTCKFDDERPAYWVLQVRGYSDTAADYSPLGRKADITEHLIDLGYLDNPAVTVYDGSREPWNEEDPYPDFVVSRGPRGGVVWERA